MSDEYATRQAMRDQDHARNYTAWIAALSPDERRRMEELGLAEPLKDADGYGWGSSDAAEFHEASELPAMPTEPEPAPVPSAPIENEEVLDILRRLIGELPLVRDARVVVPQLPSESIHGFGIAREK